MVTLFETTREKVYGGIMCDCPPIPKGTRAFYIPAVGNHGGIYVDQHGWCGLGVSYLKFLGYVNFQEQPEFAHAHQHGFC